MTTPVATGEAGCSLGSGTVTLSGTAADYCGAFGASGLSDGASLCVTVIKDTSNVSVYSAATYHTGSPATITLGSATKTVGSLSPGDTVMVLGTAVSAADIGGALTSHTHSASDIASGTIATARLGSGSASASTWLRGDGAWTSLPAELDPEWCIIALTAPTATIAAKTRANFFVIPMACTVSDFSVFCDPSNKPTGTVIVDMNTVNQSTGASTSALSATAQIASGANTGTGTSNGTLTCAAGDMIDWDIDQGTTGKGLFAKFKMNPTG